MENMKAAEMEGSKETVDLIKGVRRHRYVAPPNQFNSFWTVAKTDELKFHFAKGESAGEIRQALGAPSRGAVCGKIHRLGLARENGYRARATLERIARDAQPKSAPKKKLRGLDFRKPDASGFVGQLVVAEEYVERIAFDVPVEQRKTIMQLRNNHCRWPYGDPLEPGFYYCGGDGADLLGHRPWCSGHTLLAAAPPRQRVRKQVEIN